MTITWKTLGQAVLTAGNTTVYGPALASRRASVSAAQLWNPTGAPVTVSVYLLRSGGAVSDGTKIDSIVVPATTAKTVFGLINQKVEPGGSIVAVGNGVTLTVSGSESV